VRGPEELLAERAVSATLRDLHHVAPDLDVIRITAASYQPGELATHTSPSLFGGDKALIVERLDEATDELVDDLTAYLQVPADDVTLVVTHSGAQRGKRAVEALVKQKARVIECPAIKTDRDKTDFVVNEFRREGRKATPEAVRALVEALGRDTRELASAVAQLVADTEGVVDDRVVELYHGGKVEATGFRVADAAVAGQTGEHAIATGVDPVPIVAVLASSLRQLVKVGSAGRGSSQQLAKQLGLASWQVDKSRRQLSHWTADGLGRAIQAVAAADVEVKGGGRDPVFAVERAVLSITAARHDG
jgi:DNA polymerase III subunit delta